MNKEDAKKELEKDGFIVVGNFVLNFPKRLGSYEIDKKLLTERDKELFKTLNTNEGMKQ